MRDVKQILSEPQEVNPTSKMKEEIKLTVVKNNTDFEQVAYPSKLYKYRDWEEKHHKTVLTDGVLYFSSPRDFYQDPKDCNLVETFPEGQDLLDYLRDVFYKYPEDRNGMTEAQFVDYWSINSPLANVEKREKLQKKFLEEFFDLFGVLSLTIDCQNDRMWSEYANCHKGFCVGFDSKTLLPCVGGGALVNYVDELPEIDFWKDDFNMKHYKRIFYKERRLEFEKEYRVHKMWKSKVSNEQRQIKFPPESLVDIYLGKCMPAHYKDEIREIAAEKYPNAIIVEL